MRKAIESDYKKNYIGVKSYERNPQIVDMIARHTIGHMPICELQEFHVEMFYDYIKSYSNDTINKITATMKGAFDIAVQKGIVETNIMASEMLLNLRTSILRRDMCTFAELLLQPEVTIDL